MEHDETLAWIRREVRDIGAIYYAQCSLVIDHGYGRLSVVAKCDPRQSVVHFEVSSLSADLEQSPPRKHVLAVGDLILFLTGALLSETSHLSAVLKKPVQGEDKPSPEERFLGS